MPRSMLDPAKIRETQIGISATKTGNLQYPCGKYAAFYLCIKRIHQSNPFMRASIKEGTVGKYYSINRKRRCENS